VGEHDGYQSIAQRMWAAVHLGAMEGFGQRGRGDHEVISLLLLASSYQASSRAGSSAYQA